MSRTRRVLLVALDNWYNTARLPVALKSAGIEVGLLSEPGSLVSRSVHLDRQYIRHRHRDQRGWLRWVETVISDFAPDFIIPADEDAVRLVHFVVLNCRNSWPPSVIDLLERSLGSVATLRDRSHRQAILRRAARLGVACPAGRSVHHLHDAVAFQRACGGPVVIKADHSHGGLSVMVCTELHELQYAYASLSHRRITTSMRLQSRLREAMRRSGLGRDPVLEGAGRAELSIEALVPGQPVFHTAIARDGVWLDGFSADVEMCHPMPNGPSTRVLLHHCPEMAAAAKALIADLGFTGVCGLDFIRDADGRLTLLEFNQRPTSVSHLGHHVGADLYATLADGQPRAFGNRDAQTQHVILYPQDWLRDPTSTDRCDQLIDWPIGEPHIAAAMQARIELAAAAGRAAQGAQLTA